MWLGADLRPGNSIGHRVAKKKKKRRRRSINYKNNVNKTGNKSRPKMPTKFWMLLENTWTNGQGLRKPQLVGAVGQEVDSG